MEEEPKPSLQSLELSPDTGRSSAWRNLLLPAAIGLGFLIVFAVVVGPRLIPATPVQAVPAMAVPGETSPERAPTRRDATKREPLFQAAGWVEPDPFPLHVAALVQGIVEEIEVIEGDRVSAGDLIATMVDEDAELDLASAEAALAEAESELETARAAAAAAEATVSLRRSQVQIAEPQLKAAEDRQQRLESIESGAIAQGELIRARLETSRRLAELNSAKAEIPVAIAQHNRTEAQSSLAQARVETATVARDRARLMLDRTRITAPTDGIILRLLRAPGTKVTLTGENSNSATIAMLYQPHQLQVRVDVPLKQVARVFVGQAAVIRSDLLPDQSFEGKVTSLVGEADLQRNSLQVKVRIEKPDILLRPDMLCRVSFLNYPTEPAEPGDPVAPGDPEAGASDAPASTGSGDLFTTLIPAAALPSDWQPDRETTVWVVDPDQRAERRTIVPGSAETDGEVIIREGLRAGEPVVIDPPADLSPGQRLQVELPNT